MYGTIVQIATSLYCRADGFRSFIFAFLVILVVFMIIGHASIRVYQRGMVEQRWKAASLVQQSTGQGVPLVLEDERALAEPLVCGVRLIRFKQLHGAAMCIAYSMLFGAGIMFTVRAKQLANCQNFYAKGHADAVSVGNVIFELDGALVLGALPNFSQPEL
jgi:hypothetical protein